MKTVLVKYVQRVDEEYLGTRFLDKSKIVKVEDLEDLNDMFRQIVDVKILEDDQQDLPGEKV